LYSQRFSGVIWRFLAIIYLQTQKEEGMVQETIMEKPCFRKISLKDLTTEPELTLDQIIRWANKEGLSWLVPMGKMRNFNESHRLERGEIVFCITGLRNGMGHLWIIERTAVSNEQIVTPIGFRKLHGNPISSHYKFLLL
jgi:hypothetical protein